MHLKGALHDYSKTKSFATVIYVYEVYPFLCLLYLINTGALFKDKRPARNNFQEYAIITTSTARRYIRETIIKRLKIFSENMSQNNNS